MSTWPRRLIVVSWEQNERRTPHTHTRTAGARLHINAQLFLSSGLRLRADDEAVHAGGINARREPELRSRQRPR